MIQTATRERPSDWFELAERGTTPGREIQAGVTTFAAMAYILAVNPRILAEAGVPHVLVELPWGVHAFDYNLHGPGGQLTRYAVAEFLRAVCVPIPANVRK